MFRLLMLVFSIVGPILVGVGVVTALVTGQDQLWPLAFAGALGLALSLPVSWLVAKRMR